MEDYGLKWNHISEFDTKIQWFAHLGGFGKSIEYEYNILNNLKNWSGIRQEADHIPNKFNITHHTNHSSTKFKQLLVRQCRKLSLQYVFRGGVFGKGLKFQASPGLIEFTKNKEGKTFDIFKNLINKKESNLWKKYHHISFNSHEVSGGRVSNEIPKLSDSLHSKISKFDGCKIRDCNLELHTTRNGKSIHFKSVSKIYLTNGDVINMGVKNWVYVKDGIMVLKYVYAIVDKWNDSVIKCYACGDYYDVLSSDTLSFELNYSSFNYFYKTHNFSKPMVVNIKHIRERVFVFHDHTSNCGVKSKVWQCDEKYTKFYIYDRENGFSCLILENNFLYSKVNRKGKIVKY